MAPSYKLDVSGDVRVSGALRDGAGAGGAAGQVLASTGTGIQWADPTAVSDGDWQLDGADMYSIPSGNVGIGTAVPDKLFTVQGDAHNEYIARFENTNSDPGANYGVLLRAGSASGSDAALRIEDSSGNIQMIVAANRVGIGTNPLAYCDIFGSTGAVHGAKYGFRNRHTVTGGLIVDYYGGYMAAPNVEGGSITNKYAFVTEEGAGNVGIGTVSPNYELQVDGVVSMFERTSDPAEPTEGECIVWMSDGTGKGDDGDVLIASKVGGVAKWATLFDHSAGADW